MIADLISKDRYLQKATYIIEIDQLEERNSKNTLKSPENIQNTLKDPKGIKNYQRTLKILKIIQNILKITKQIKSF